VRINRAELVKPRGCPLKPVAGSDDAACNNVLPKAVMQALFVPASLPEERRTELVGAALASVHGFHLRDEVEGMMVAQALALHHAAMECARRAMIAEQPSEAADRLCRKAANMPRAMVDMAEAIERRRRKGPQVVRVERVVVHDGGQAIVGAVVPSLGAGRTGGGAHAELRGTPHACRAGAMRGAGAGRAPVQGRRDAQRALPDARRRQHRSADLGGLGAAAGGPDADGAAHRRHGRAAARASRDRPAGAEGAEGARTRRLTCEPLGQAELPLWYFGASGIWAGLHHLAAGGEGENLMR
jgi:hypothetical protein